MSSVVWQHPRISAPQKYLPYLRDVELATTQVRPLLRCFSRANAMPHFCEQHPQHLPPSPRGQLCCPPFSLPTNTVLSNGQCPDQFHPLPLCSVFRQMRFLVVYRVAVMPLLLCYSLCVPYGYLHLPQILRCAHSVNLHMSDCFSVTSTGGHSTDCLCCCSVVLCACHTATFIFREFLDALILLIRT